MYSAMFMPKLLYRKHAYPAYMYGLGLAVMHSVTQIHIYIHILHRQMPGNMPVHSLPTDIYSEVTIQPLISSNYSAV